MVTTLMKEKTDIEWYITIYKITSMRTASQQNIFHKNNLLSVEAVKTPIFQLLVTGKKWKSVIMCNQLTWI